MNQAEWDLTAGAKSALPILLQLHISLPAQSNSVFEKVRATAFVLYGMKLYFNN